MRNVGHRSIGDIRNSQAEDFILEFLRIFRSRIAGAEAAKAESVVNALTENTAHLLLTLHNENILHSVFPQFYSRCKACRTSSYNKDIDIFH